MLGILNGLIRKSAARVQSEHIVRNPVRLPSSLSSLGATQKKVVEEMVILGVLLSCVAYADDELSAKEEDAILRILTRRGSISKEHAALVIAAAREAKENRPDIQGFTREVNKKSYTERLEVLELLFRVAFADLSLSHLENEEIRRIARLLWITHKDFIDMKLKVKTSVGQ